MIRYIKTFEVIFSTNNLSGMHISTMWHSLNVLKYFCPLSVYFNCVLIVRIDMMPIDQTSEWCQRRYIDLSVVSELQLSGRQLGP